MFNFKVTDPINIRHLPSMQISVSQQHPRCTALKVTDPINIRHLHNNMALQIIEDSTEGDGCCQHPSPSQEYTLHIIIKVQ